ncbi:hypothetical protein [Bacillus wiedmannii]|uniref:hypothetical protein n=1 Tax=Bacillus wiedmannii TaxID=1890302 RepID=UPI000BF0E3CC|nr:hypothetical protein [Bacillus wiedmannii]PEK57860.1 hypothetical protein CN595_24765 [Bacillus wiedmannii]
MKRVEFFLENYISELSIFLKGLPKVQRESYIEEMKDHLTLFIKDKQAKGYSEKEILNQIKKEFDSPEQLGNQILDENNEVETGTKTRFIIIGTILIVLALPMFFSNLGSIPLAMLILVYSYLVFTKKYLWGLFLFKKNPNKIKNTTKFACLSGIYLFCVGVLILLDNILDLTNVLLLFVAGFLVFSLIFIKKDMNFK